MSVAQPHAEAQQQFVTATEGHRRALLAHCYRMIGALGEAEDAVGKHAVLDDEEIAALADHAVDAGGKGRQRQGGNGQCEGERQPCDAGRHCDTLRE